MGGPRASTDRKRLRGETCWSCKRLLPPPFPGRERACDECEQAKASPGKRIVTVHIQKSSWTATFSRWVDNQRFSVGPWMVFNGEDGLLAMLRRGEISPDAWKDYENSMRQWGVANIPMALTEAQYIRLLESGIRDRRTGHEKIKAKTALTGGR